MTSKPLQSKRYFVPDLSPEGREELRKIKPKWIFVAESPHINEIEPEEMKERRPLCGMAGRKWWSLLSELLEGHANSDVSLERLIQFCRVHRVAIMNSVQVPLDPKIATKFPKADPVKNIGFSKLSGSHSFKKLKGSEPVRGAIEALGARLRHDAVKNAKVVCLGNDAEWFVRQALGEAEAVKRLGDKIPHPSAWWRRGGYFGRVAKENLQKVFS